MPATDMVPGTSAGLNSRQVSALEKLHELGAEPRKSEVEPYSDNPKIRALQLVYEDKLGGPGRGQGRKPRGKRAAAAVAEDARRLAKEIGKVYEDLLKGDDAKLRMAAADRLLDVENREATLQLKEEEFDSTDDIEGKEELIDALFDAIENPEVEAVIQNAIEIPAEDITEIEAGDADFEPEPDGEDPEWLEADPADPPANGVDTSAARGNGRAHAARNGKARANPFSQAAKRRAADTG